MHIGTPITVKRNEDITTVTKGDIGKMPESVLYNFFEKNKSVEDVIITSNGEPVAKTDIAEYLKTILSENLEINSTLAEKGLQEPFEESDVKLV